MQIRQIASTRRIHRPATVFAGIRKSNGSFTPGGVRRLVNLRKAMSYSRAGGLPFATERVNTLADARKGLHGHAPSLGPPCEMMTVIISSAVSLSLTPGGISRSLRTRKYAAEAGTSGIISCIFRHKKKTPLRVTRFGWIPRQTLAALANCP